MMGAKTKAMIMRRAVLIGAGIILCLVIAMIVQGFNFQGPLKGLSALGIVHHYDSRTQTGEVVFYGPSNFAYWETMDADLLPYAVQNHGVGGSTDKDLIRFADWLLYPYKPYAVVLQNGTNDYLTGPTPKALMEYKDKLYTRFREKLPDAYFVILSGLPLPGRAQFWEEEQQVNAYLKAYCNKHDKMLYVDATKVMTTASGDFKPEYFSEDGIHLNAAGRKAWATVIKEALSEINAPKR